MFIGAHCCVYSLNGPVQATPSECKNIAWGMLVVVALAGISHIVKTWAWRLALLGEAKKVSFWRTLALRLISEAIGQFGFVGLVFGESARVALLGPGVQVSSAISSVAMDRGLFIVAGAVVTITGICRGLRGVLLGCVAPLCRHIRARSCIPVGVGRARSP